MEAAAIMAIVLANGDGKPPDWQDFVGIICLLLINSTISFWEENNAGNAAAALMAGLAPKTKVYILTHLLNLFKHGNEHVNEEFGLLGGLLSAIGKNVHCTLILSWWLLCAGS